MADVRRVERRLRDAADGEHAAAARELSGERQPGLDLRAASACGSTVAVPGCVGTTFHRSTASLEAELVEHAVDDRRRRLAGRLSRELPLGGERDAGDARAAVAGRLADEQQRRVGAGVEVARRGARRAARRGTG